MVWVVVAFAAAAGDDLGRGDWNEAAHSAPSFPGSDHPVRAPIVVAVVVIDDGLKGRPLLSRH